ncbi:Beta-galactosidase 8-like protein [Drosera capensis]
MATMRGRETARAMLAEVIIFLSVLTMTSFGANVTYDHRALVIDGNRRLLISGSIHYPRSTPEMWPDLIQKSKDGGLNVIETYVFWDLHEPVQGQYDFSGGKDLVKFIKLVGDAGLYAHLRIGPYVCAEWNYGGFPLWLHFVPGIVFRTDNQPFKDAMQKFTVVIVDLIKKNNLYASQGGPIILSQIENEYGDIESQYGSGAKPYINWAANMALSLDTGVPWVMCQQADAPDPIINTCNGFYCDQFTPNSNKKPKLWTENWSGWFSTFGNPIPYRPVEDLAFAVVRFFQRGGTLQNYYMYHGGTNFGRTAGGPFISTSYDYDAPIDEYGIIDQPKWGHLKDVHGAIMLCEEALLATDPAYSSLGANMEATVYKTGSGSCAAFLANVGTSDANVNFNGNSYQLPAWSVSILPDCKSVALNTAKINSVSILPKFTPQALNHEIDSLGGSESSWACFSEPIGISTNDVFTKTGLLEQISTTADQSDYLWYSASIGIKGDELFLQNGSATVLHIDSLGHGLHAFINGKPAGTQFGHSGNAKISIDLPITLTQGTNKIDLLSLTIGLQNYGAFFDVQGAGITGPVLLKGSTGDYALSLSTQTQQWTYQVGLKGETLDLPDGSSSEWQSTSAFPLNQPLTWYKTTFSAPGGNDPVALDFTGMGKGEAWVNGDSIGRYWPTFSSGSTGCTNSCNYRGAYFSSKCLKNCGQPTQQLYHVPRSWLKPTGNILVVFEEIGGDPTKISWAMRQTGSICSHVSESHPAPVDTWGQEKKSGPVVALECPSSSQVISSIKFASFGTPGGTCGSFAHGKCKSTRALSIVQKACVGSQGCSIPVSINTFGDPCFGVKKSLAVEAVCT